MVKPAQTSLSGQVYWSNMTRALDGVAGGSAYIDAEQESYVSRGTTS